MFHLSFPCFYRNSICFVFHFKFECHTCTFCECLKTNNRLSLEQLKYIIKLCKVYYCYILSLSLGPRLHIQVSDISLFLCTQAYLSCGLLSATFLRKADMECMTNLSLVDVSEFYNQRQPILSYCYSGEMQLFSKLFFLLH